MLNIIDKNNDNTIAIRQSLLHLLQGYKKYFNDNVIAIAVFILLIVLTFHDFILNIQTSILFCAADPALNLYFLKWGADYLLDNVAGVSIFNLPLAYPFLNSLAFSDNLFGNQIIFLPLYVMTGKPLLSYNLWILITYFLNYILMYSYLKNSKFIGMEGNRLIAIVGATIFTFSLPSINLMGGHLQLLPLYFIPISLYFLEKQFITQKSKYYILFGLAISFQFYLGIQTGFILLILLMLLLPLYYYYLGTNQKISFINILLLGVSFVIPTLTLLLPYFQTAKLTGYRSYNDVLNYIPSLADFFSVDGGEKAIFMGIPLFLLFLIAIFLVNNARSKILFGIIILSYMFFLKETHIFQLFHAFIPGFDSIRTPGRFIFVSITLIAIFVTFVFANQKNNFVKYVSLLFLLGMAYSLFNKPVLSQEYNYGNQYTTPELVKLINNEPTLVLPLYEIKIPDLLTVIDRMKNVNMQYQIIDIYSGFNPNFVDEIEKQYLYNIHTKSDAQKFIYRILRLGFKNIYIEKKQAINSILLQEINSSGSFKNIYENDTTILYLYIGSSITTVSLNTALKTVPWQFQLKSYKLQNDKTVFQGLLLGELSGVVQKKEQISTALNIDGEEYPCQLQLDSIKDSFSSFECISTKNFSEFPSMDKPLNEVNSTMELVSFPDVQTVNQMYVAVVNVKNISKAAWASVGKYPISLSYKFYDEKGRELQLLGTGSEGEPLRTPFNSGYLSSNSADLLNMNFKTPYKAGTYLLEIDLVQDGAFWFKDKGSRVIHKTIVVKEKR